jgi:hypothetical protein
MTSKRYLSDKKSKISQTTISTSPVLKDWVSRYVNVQHRKYPEDDRFKSISAFYNFVMESTLNILEEGKTLDDFNRFVDGDIKNFYDNITFRAILPLYESSVELNKYVKTDLNLLFKLSLRYRSFCFEKSSIQNDKTLERYRNFLLKNKITKLFNFEIIDNRIIIEYAAHYPNIFFVHIKMIIAISSAMGLRVIDILYDKYDNYVKINTEKTDLFLDNKIRIKERKSLLIKNISFILNNFNIIRDKTQHLWIELSENTNTIISFKDVKTGFDYLKNLIQDIQKHVNREELNHLILKIFSNFHWINIIDENNLSFQIVLNEKNGKEREIMNKTISYYSKIKEIDGKSYLE